MLSFVGRKILKDFKQVNCIVKKKMTKELHQGPEKQDVRPNQIRQ